MTGRNWRVPVVVRAAILVSILTVLLVACASRNINDSLEGYWTFDEGSGVTIHDSAGTSPDGVAGGPPAWSDGVFGSALYVWINDELVLAEEYSITVWFRAEFLLRHQDVVSVYAVGEQYPYALHGILLEVRDDGSLRYLQRFPVGGEGGADVFAEGAYNDGQWHHAAMVKDGDGTRLYIDGQLAGANEEGAVETPDVPMGICLGHLDLERDPDRQFKGSIDDLRIYSIALTSDEIAEVMAGPADPRGR